MTLRGHSKINLKRGLNMKRLTLIGAICAAVFFTGAISLFAQDDHHDDEKRQEERHDEHEKAEVRHDEHVKRIDDAHFRAHFGHDHHFAIRHVTMVGGRPHFAYGGYNFEIVDAWPHGWSYNDNVYVDYVDGGYFLYNLAHPGLRISVTVL
jgi:Ni/Co efflux regulator RcnB